AYAEKYSASGIVNRLVPRNLDRSSPVEFYAVQVIDPDDNVAGSAAAQDFRSQMQEVIKEYGKRVRERRKAQLGAGFDEASYHVNADYFDPRRMLRSGIDATVKSQYDRLIAQADSTGKQIERLRKGQWVRTKFTAEQERVIDQALKEASVHVTLE